MTADQWREAVSGHVFNAAKVVSHSKTRQGFIFVMPYIGTTMVILMMLKLESGAFRIELGIDKKLWTRVVAGKPTQKQIYKAAIGLVFKGANEHAFTKFMDMLDRSMTKKKPGTGPGKEVGGVTDENCTLLGVPNGTCSSDYG